MKPDTQTAMTDLIAEVRKVIPFGLSETELCSGTCKGCSKKLLEFLDQELSEWSLFIEQGGKPKLGDVSKLARISTKVYKALEKNNLVNSFDTDN
ncbi:hypothetical protein M3P05_13010 [Sansalvadorimonas sp. 2012CJ34-2]|uniref:Uncharacterized protein n=1 Tax=Parendozoicomonas callyspongiae TaxID=2942213 RepID=A0ABT0PHJ2_9GAMM|nr:hypothetical protein [Sansalvadorimonas sp. 2012CJ34-2]MCL6270843.1 hypothetical protein [Sansalvadorimonas sp. 2012CJ34-2]